MPINWHDFHRREMHRPAVVDPRRRLRICLAVFVLGLAVVFGRAVQIEVSQGAAFRAEAARPIRKQKDIPGVRGRILARDGTVLARDEQVQALAVHYRYLEEPPDARWLRQTARGRLPRRQRRDPQRVAGEESRLCDERAELYRRLAELCGLRPDQWSGRAREIQARVERIAQNVNRGSPDPVPVAEELDYHVMVENVPLAVMAEIEGNPQRFPGVKIIERSRRVYPSGSLAAHVLGHLSEPDADRQPLAASQSSGDLVGCAGVERQYESLLRGRRGTGVEIRDHGGRVLTSYREAPPGVGRDLVLTLDPRLQRAAEQLLDSALARRAIRDGRPDSAGGAVVVMDVESGQLLACASAPRFDPSVFGPGGDRRQRAALLADKEEAHPLFDRAVQMALPPGSVFKTLTAAALIESGVIEPHETYACQGYLDHPDQQRCAIYVHQGIGHGEVTLADALAQSCNVYFFHFARAWHGPDVLLDWARRFGFGSPAGVDLPGETGGVLPTPESIRRLGGRAWSPADTEALAIGQGSLTVTPLGIVRLMAAVANGGRLVTPHVVKDVGRIGKPSSVEQASSLAHAQAGTLMLRAQAVSEDPDEPDAELLSIPPPRPIPGLRASTLAAIREGLERVVADPQGTAHDAVYLESVPIAGKTGTASAGEDRLDHAWFAGYVPADRPRLAFVVVLEHAGDAATAAGPVAKRLVLQMKQLGLLD